MELDLGFIDLFYRPLFLTLTMLQVFCCLYAELSRHSVNISYGSNITNNLFLGLLTDKGSLTYFPRFFRLPFLNLAFFQFLCQPFSLIMLLNYSVNLFSIPSFFNYLASQEVL